MSDDAQAKRNEMRSKLLARSGIDVADCSADEWLALAVDAEAQKIAVGPFDPAFEFFAKRERQYMEAAVIREQQ